ncbi:hypothetical protein KGP84_17570, partial [Burkholderia multivorans]
MATQAEHGAQLSAAGRKPGAAAAGLLLVRTLFLRCSCAVPALFLRCSCAVPALFLRCSCAVPALFL